MCTLTTRGDPLKTLHPFKANSLVLQLHDFPVPSCKSLEGSAAVFESEMQSDVHECFQHLLQDLALLGALLRAFHCCVEAHAPLHQLYQSVFDVVCVQDFFNVLSVSIFSCSNGLFQLF